MQKSLKILVIILVLAYGIYMIWNGMSKMIKAKKTVTPTTVTTLEGGFVQCETEKQPRCFIDNFLACTKAKLEMAGNDGTKIFMTIFGMENDKCHYNMEVSGHGVDCLFNKADLDEKLINQIFGNDEGKKEITDAACTMF